MIFISILTILITVFILIKYRNILYAVIFNCIALLSVYVIFYKINLELVFRQFSLFDYYSITFYILIALGLLYLYKLVDKTKIINDWHNFILLLFPYNLHKMIFMYLVIMILPFNYKYILIFVLLIHFFVRGLKLSRYKAIIVIIIGFTSKMLLDNYYAYETYSDTALSLTSENFIFLTVVNLLSIATIVIFEKVTFSSEKDIENKNLRVLPLIANIVLLSVIYALSMYILSNYFTVSTSIIISALILIISNVIIPRILFPIIDFIDHDEFYQRKSQNQPIITSFLVLFMIISVIYLVAYGYLIFAVVPILFLIILLTKYYKITFKDIDFEIKEIVLLTLFVIIFRVNDQIIELSANNSFNFGVSFPNYLIDSTIFTSNSLIGNVLYILQAGLIFNSHIYFVFDSVTGFFDINFLIRIISIVTIINGLFISFLLFVFKVKKDDYDEVIGIGTVFLLIYIIILMSITIFLN